VLKPKSVIDKEKQEAWERLREVLDRVHEKIGEVSEEEVERDVLKAIREIREQEYGKGRAAAVGCYLPFHHPPDVL
jgi:predicted transcriptional regulator